MAKFAGKIIRAYRDRVRLEHDLAKAGSQQPRFETLIAELPCFIMYLGGAERLTARKLEGYLDYVVECEYFEDFGRFHSNMRMVVLSGPQLDMILNVDHVEDVREVGRSFQTRFYCKELD